MTNQKHYIFTITMLMVTKLIRVVTHQRGGLVKSRDKLNCISTCSICFSLCIYWGISQLDISRNFCNNVDGETIKKKYYLDHLRKVLQVCACVTFQALHRSRHLEVFLRNGALKICRKFTAEHPCRRVFCCKFAVYFQNTFSQEHLWVAPSDYRVNKRNSFTKARNDEVNRCLLAFKNHSKKIHKYFVIKKLICKNFKIIPYYSWKLRNWKLLNHLKIQKYLACKV